MAQTPIWAEIIEILKMTKTLTTMTGPLTKVEIIVTISTTRHKIVATCRVLMVNKCKGSEMRSLRTIPV